MAHPGDELFAVGKVQIAAEAAEFGQHLDRIGIGSARQVAPDEGLRGAVDICMACMLQRSVPVIS